MQRILHHGEILLRLDQTPILIDNAKNGIIELRFEVGSRLLHVALRNENWAVIHHVSASAEQMLSNRECGAGCERRVEESEAAVGGKPLCAETKRKVCSTLKLLVVGNIRALLQLTQRLCARQSSCGRLT